MDPHMYILEARTDSTSHRTLSISMQYPLVGTGGAKVRERYRRRRASVCADTGNGWTRQNLPCCQWHEFLWRPGCQWETEGGNTPTQN